MKPMGPVPPFFEGEEGMLLIGGCGAASLVDEAGDTPLFVYDMGIVERQVRDLRDAMPAQLSIHYAVKANPYPALLERMARLVDGFDVASGGELARALEAGMDAAHVSFAGPGKRDDELAAAIDAGVTLNLESEGEARRALAIAEKRGRTPRLAVRVNPDFDLKGSGMRMGGGAKPFGVDADRAAGLARTLIDAGADWRGWHIFAGSQALAAEALIETQAATVGLAARLSDAVGVAPPLVNLGGGFGIPYFPGDQRLDIAPIGDALSQTLQARADILADSEFAMELGRWLVGEAGVYLTRVVDVKQSQGETFVVVDGGLHHQLAASGNFGTVVRRNYPMAVANRYGASPAEEAVTVVGCLCTPIDKLGDKVALPPMVEGDLIAIFAAGAYGASASPSAFLGHPPALELLLG
ncbi:pyridoxal-dependent decarboxylase, exosortase A system-associated [Sphingomonadales bacterium 56]|uniref:Pyridoxal-dependent decarboxylase, exosortase A system-associated n=1 Tax=Sphingobium agri TaxID=2933566 RepID=A0ABT0DXI5_9SPHN|nr:MULTISPECIES: pyridoxal-dependent decarboxylase, exosortase A system-associated [Sphingobium]MBY2927524.1 pyridoxal-dependent decarboxylase, exosortase A system-associated [Sphingomonadales bacterium 56]MBY2957624.1 pyridoxal-dependent decarboxylase, exosortase A system-associated [Sphingomonadales bacterium 58]MCK0531734.1 pyridoxal-dependent decarboxylase, exosortase A system-associated [Sphingobium agri]CAD7335400.1 L-glutamyl-[BtrI acyl-carrier protein] decarboxylase [Sphingobium sp. S6]